MHIVIVIPVFNDANFLQHCLESISQQTIMPDRVIVVDNNCTDTSVEVARKYSFVTVVTEKTQGICAAAKTGYDAAAMASADVILRCDADSRPSSTWVESMIEHFAKNPAAIAVTGPGVFYDLPKPMSTLASLLYMRPYFFSVGLALGQTPLFGSNCAFRSDAWNKVKHATHLSQQDIHDDIDLSYHVETHGKIIYDKQLTMPISGRPFTSLRSFIQRFSMGYRSITIHWPQQAPWRIYRQKFAHKKHRQ